jgi:hypothetical protein
MELAELLLRLLLNVVLTVGFAALAFFSLRIAADGQRATALSTRVATRLSGTPAWIRGNEWAYSKTGLRLFGFAFGLASLNFVLIGLHLTPLAFISASGFIVLFLVASAMGFNYVARRKGLNVALFRELRALEILAWLVMMLYTIGVLALANVILT